MTTYRLTVAALLFTAACSAPTAPVPIGSASSGLYTVVISPDDDLAPETAAAVSQWQQAGAAIIVGAVGIPVRYGTPSGKRLGEYANGVVTLRHGMTEGLHRMTLLHELGHVLGVPHLSTGLMTYGYEGTLYECIDAEAAAAIGGSSTCEPGDE